MHPVHSDMLQTSLQDLAYIPSLPFVHPYTFTSSHGYM